MRFQQVCLITKLEMSAGESRNKYLSELLGRRLHRPLPPKPTVSIAANNCDDEDDDDDNDSGLDPMNHTDR